MATLIVTVIQAKQSQKKTSIKRDAAVQPWESVKMIALHF